MGDASGPHCVRRRVNPESLESAIRPQGRHFPVWIVVAHKL